MGGASVSALGEWRIIRALPLDIDILGLSCAAPHRARRPRGPRLPSRGGPRQRPHPPRRSSAWRRASAGARRWRAVSRMPTSSSRRRRVGCRWGRGPSGCVVQVREQLGSHLMAVRAAVSLPPHACLLDMPAATPIATSRWWMRRWARRRRPSRTAGWCRCGPTSRWRGSRSFTPRSGRQGAGGGAGKPARGQGMSRQPADSGGSGGRSPACSCSAPSLPDHCVRLLAAHATSTLPPGCLQHLKPHQKEGLQFIWNALELDFQLVRGQDLCARLATGSLVRAAPECLSASP